MGLPAKWIVITSGIALSGGGVALATFTSFFPRLAEGLEVRELVRFRERFQPERYPKSCPSEGLHRGVACVRRMIDQEQRLKYASMTGRIFYLNTVAQVHEISLEFARIRHEQLEARADFLDYLNEEMKNLILQNGGAIGSPADNANRTPAQTPGSPVFQEEEKLRKQYHLTLVELWMREWAQNEKYFAGAKAFSSEEITRKISILRADRDELLSRLSLDIDARR